MYRVLVLAVKSFWEIFDHGPGGGYMRMQGRGRGGTFSPCTVEAFIAMLGNVLETYREHPDSFRALQHRGMERNSSWGQGGG